MAASEPVHFMTLMGLKTACGKKQVIYRTSVRELVTCPSCKVKLGI